MAADEEQGASGDDAARGTPLPSKLKTQAQALKTLLS